MSAAFSNTPCNPATSPRTLATDDSKIQNTSAQLPATQTLHTTHHTPETTHTTHHTPQTIDTSETKSPSRCRPRFQIRHATRPRAQEPSPLMTARHQHRRTIARDSAAKLHNVLQPATKKKQREMLAQTSKHTLFQIC